MFAKLFSRITESSLMEEPLAVRYAFMMLLAMCDPTGHVIGTDVAIARRMNMPLEEFKKCAEALFQSDPDSNSREEDGRRIIPSENERGYKVVNYLTYRDMKSEEHKRDYMREYMRKRRENEALANGKTPVKRVKRKLTVLNHAEGEGEGDANAEAKPELTTRAPSSGSEHQKFIDDWCKYYELRTKTKYAFQAGRDGKAAKILLGHFQGADPAKEFIKSCHARSGTGFPFNTVDTLSDLANNISRLQAALSSPLRINGHARPTEAQRDQEKTGLPPQEFPNLKLL